MFLTPLSPFPLLSSCVLTAGSPVMVWLTVQMLTEMRRWAEASATAAAPQNTKSRSAELKWTPLWVRTTLRLDNCNRYTLITALKKCHNAFCLR